MKTIFSDSKILSNGQVATIELRLTRIRGTGIRVYDVVAAIANNPISAKKFCRGRADHFDGVATGRAGLEGLLFFKSIVERYVALMGSKHMPYGRCETYLVVQGADEQRERVYSRLTKIGFYTGTWYDQKAYIKAWL